jgi:hypothetical protein
MASTKLRKVLEAIIVTMYRLEDLADDKLKRFGSALVLIQNAEAT